MRLKKLKVEMIALLKEAFKFGFFSSLKCEVCGQNFETDAKVIQETQIIFGHIPKEKFETTI